MESSLRKLARKTFPPCKTLVDLETLLTQNDRIKNTFATIDGAPFYQTCLFDGLKRAALFLNPKAVEEALINDMIFVDGTFRTCPLKCAQLLVIFRIIKGTVSPKTQKINIDLISLIFYSPGFMALRLWNIGKSHCTD